MQILFLGNNSQASLRAMTMIKSLRFTYDCNVCAHNNGKVCHYPEKYDLGISFLYPFLVPKKELRKATWINFHPALLPAFGGRNVHYHVIKNNSKEFGGTVHYMSDTFDTGDIIDTKSMPLEPDFTAEDVYDFACDALLELLEMYVPKLIQGESIPRSPQQGTQYYKQQKINDIVSMTDQTKRDLMALTFPPHYPKVKIGDTVYKIKLEKE